MSVEALIKGVAFHVISVEAIILPTTEITSRNRCGGCCGSGSCSSSGSIRGVVWAGMIRSDHWWMCGYRRRR